MNMNTPKEIVYVEPVDYFPIDIRKKCKLGEFAEEPENVKNEEVESNKEEGDG